MIARLCLASLLAPLIFLLGQANATAGTLFWVGSSGNASGAGGGTWDNSSTAWSTTSGGTANTAWSGSSDAIFQGTAGGTVTVNANLNINSVTFNNGDGAFTISNTFDLNFNGAGVIDNATQSQVFSSNAGTIEFNNSSSASAGTSAARYTSNSVMTFSGSSTAGNAIIGNSGQLSFIGASQGGTSAITNSGDLDIDLLTTAGLSAASLDNSGSVDLGLGTGGTGKTLTLTTLTLEGGSEFDFTLGTTASLITAGTVTDHSSSTNRVTIDAEAGSGFGAASYVLVHDAGGTLTFADFSIGSAPSGYALQLANSGHDLDLVAVVPESSSYVTLVAGAGLLIGLRRRR